MFCHDCIYLVDFVDKFFLLNKFLFHNFFDLPYLSSNLIRSYLSDGTSISIAIKSFLPTDVIL